MSNLVKEIREQVIADLKDYIAEDIVNEIKEQTNVKELVAATTQSLTNKIDSSEKTILDLQSKFDNAKEIFDKVSSLTGYQGKNIKELTESFENFIDVQKNKANGQLGLNVGLNESIKVMESSYEALTRSQDNNTAHKEQSTPKLQHKQRA